MISLPTIQVRCDGVLPGARRREGVQCQAGEAIFLEEFLSEAAMLRRLHLELVGWTIFADRRVLCPVCGRRAEGRAA